MVKDDIGQNVLLTCLPSSRERFVRNLLCSLAFLSWLSVECMCSMIVLI